MTAMKTLRLIGLSALLGACSVTLDFDDGAKCDGADQCPTGFRCIKDRCVESGPKCGDYVVDDGEVCDDGNTEEGDGCSRDCQSHETCGNGIVDDGKRELCDEGDLNGTYGHCTVECDRVRNCGDGTIDTTIAELTAKAKAHLAVTATSMRRGRRVRVAMGIRVTRARLIARPCQTRRSVAMAGSA